MEYNECKHNKFCRQTLTTTGAISTSQRGYYLISVLYYFVNAPEGFPFKNFPMPGNAFFILNLSLASVIVRHSEQGYAFRREFSNSLYWTIAAPHAFPFVTLSIENL